MLENPDRAASQPATRAGREAFTRLDLFAAAAMHSLLTADKGISTDRLVIDSYKIAQAMLDRSEKLAHPRPPGPAGPPPPAGARASQLV